MTVESLLDGVRRPATLLTMTHRLVVMRRALAGVKRTRGGMPPYHRIGR